MTITIRLHLWHLEMAVIGDSSYLLDAKIGETQTLPIDGPPMCLHAWRMAFTHPLNGERVVFETERAEWA